MNSPASTAATLDHPFGEAAGWEVTAGAGWRIEKTVLPAWQDALTPFFPDQNGKVYERLLANLPIMLHAMDRQGRITAVNGHWAAVLGYAGEEAQGRLFTEFLTASSRARLLQDIYPAYFQSGVIRAEALEMLCRDGSARSVLLSMNAYRGAKGRIERSVCLLEAAPAEAEPRQAGATDAMAAFQHVPKMEALGRLAGGLAHDFNNLLTVVAGNLELLEGHLPDQEAALRLREAIGAARKAGGLSRQLLGLVPNEAPARRKVKINGVITGMLPLLARSLGEPIELLADLTEDEPVAMLDPGQFESALLCLALHARDAMPEGGRLTIETHAMAGADGGQEVLVAVTDTGRGMRGTAPGLAMVDGFVSQSGGRLAIGGSQGEGSTLKLFLPRLAE